LADNTNQAGAKPSAYRTVRFLVKQLARCSKENSMSRFVTHFMKKVIGENGHEQEICQGIVEVDAASRAEAAELAKQKFCETERVCNWSHHADRLQVEEADFPS
jgi:hypothetical protein